MTFFHVAQKSTFYPVNRDLGTLIHPDVHSLTVHPASSDLVTATTGGGLYRSNDGGRTWQPASEGMKVPWSRHMVERFFLEK